MASICASQSPRREDDLAAHCRMEATFPLRFCRTVLFFVISHRTGLSSSLASWACLQMTKHRMISSRHHSAGENFESIWNRAWRFRGTVNPQGSLRPPSWLPEGQTPECLHPQSGWPLEKDKTPTPSPESPIRKREEAVPWGLLVPSCGPLVF